MCCHWCTRPGLVFCEAAIFRADSGLSGQIQDSRRRFGCRADFAGTGFYTYLARGIALSFAVFIIVEIVRDKRARREKLITLLFRCVAMLVSILSPCTFEEPRLSAIAPEHSILGAAISYPPGSNFAQFLLLHFGGALVGTVPTLNFLSAPAF